MKPLLISFAAILALLLPACENDGDHDDHDRHHAATTTTSTTETTSVRAPVRAESTSTTVRSY